MKKLLFFSFLFISIYTFGQHSPTFTSQGTYLGKTIPLRDFPVVEERQYRINEITVVPNNLRANEKLDASGLPLNGLDPVRQRSAGSYNSTRTVELNIDGITRGESQGFVPPDPSGAVGPNHYINAVNSVVKIFDKSGNVLAGPTALGTFLGNGTNSGDPIIMYDHLADRFFVSQFGTASNSLVLGVSETNDPTGAYFVYEYVFDNFPDYPHYSIWPDGYYLTANKGGNIFYVLDREAILAGEADPQIIGFDTPGLIRNNNTVVSAASANLTGAVYPSDVPGYLVYLQDDGWSGAITEDHLKVWEIEMDWDTASNSTISDPVEIPLDPFDSVFAPFGSGDLQQPGTGQKIDMIGGIISYAANYRAFGDHNSWLITFNVDVDGNDTAGIRWVELRNAGTGPWSVYQQGTYAPDDGLSRFMGSGAIDAQGNIGLAFNYGSSDTQVGIAYTGRFESDPLGEMTHTETNIVEGGGVQTTSNRFGDYSHLTMDPYGFTFWHTAEYFTSNNTWASRIASFRLSDGFENDLSVTSFVSPQDGILTANETVEITIINLGTSDQSNFPIELWLDGNLIATETFTGTITSTETANFTFTQTLDLSTPGQTYNLEARVLLPTDQFIANDPFTKEVKHLFNKDVGVVNITSPTSSDGLTDETVTITIRNYGADAQSDFDVQYTIDGGTPVVETVTDVINSNETLVYSFTQTADLSELGFYDIVVTTSLVDDQETDNDSASVQIENAICAPSMDCSFGDGLQLFSIADINNASGCEGYGDFRDQIANLAPGSTYPLTLTTGYGDQHVTVWIDFNSDNIFADDEKVVDNFIIAPGQTGGSYTETVDVTIPESVDVGTYRMRAKTNWQANVPDDSCTSTQYGETEDYTANIETLSTPDFLLASNSTLTIKDEDNKQFEVVLSTAYDGPAYIAIYNLNGQQLKFKNIVKSNYNSYIVKLNMSQIATGVYIVRVGGKSGNSYLTKKFLVK